MAIKAGGGFGDVITKADCLYIGKEGRESTGEHIK